MKNISLFFLACVALVAGCTKKTDELFEKTADQRLSETLSGFQNYLTAAPGWKLFVYPKGLESQDIKVGGLTYYLKFSNTNRVTMVSDFMTDIAAVPKESGYRLKALQRPSLIFDTYNYMHIPADPDPDVSFSPTGTGGNGWGTDFNFAFTGITPKDTMVLEGNFNKSGAVLVKATQAEMDAAFTKGALKNVIESSYAYANNNPFIYLPAGAGLNVGLGFDFDNVFLSLSYLQGGNLVLVNEAFSFTTYGLHLQRPVTIGSYTFQDIYWDDVKKVYYVTVGGNRVEFVSSATPVVTLPLTNVIGNQYTTITIPRGAGLPNESPLFLSRYNTIRTGILNGPYALTLDDMDFVFNAALKSMTVNVYVYQGTVGPYLCQYNYTYTVDGNGSYKFTKVAQNGNAALIVNNMNGILSFIQNDLFGITGYASSSAFLAQMTSKTTPTFYFTGVLY